MKTKTRFLLNLSLLLLLLASACAPAASTEAEAPQANLVQPATATSLVDIAATSAPAVITEAPVVGVEPVATSRGPNLEATDPATVSLASGGLQLVEFFRFT